MLLLISATEFEISQTAAWLNGHSGNLNAQKPELLTGGIGQLQTAYALTRKIHERRPGFVIQAGIGGSAVKTDIGKVFAIRRETVADLGVMEKAGFRSHFELGLGNGDHFPFQQGKLENPYHHLLEWTGLPVVDGITVNEIKSADFSGFQRNEDPVVESMEGAALHYVCLMEKLPFLQIRAVSNKLGDRDKSRWNLIEAIENLNKALVSLIQKLEQTNETLFRL
jgi:futalosine hydrolase